MTLRIATELNLKRLIVGGLERVYEIGRIFRNEGIDATHNPEFTMLELYAAYWSVHEMMDFNEALMAHLVADVHGGDTLMYKEDAISFKRPFARVSYLDAMKQWAISIARRCSRSPYAKVLVDYGIPPSPSHAHALDKISNASSSRTAAPDVYPRLPVVLSPLAKRKAGDPELTDRYELFCASMEVATPSPSSTIRRSAAAVRTADRRAVCGDDEVPPPDWIL